MIREELHTPSGRTPCPPPAGTYWALAFSWKPGQVLSTGQADPPAGLTDLLREDVGQVRKHQAALPNLL